MAEENVMDLTWNEAQHAAMECGPVGSRSMTNYVNSTSSESFLYSLIQSLSVPRKYFQQVLSNLRQSLTTNITGINFYFAKVML